MRVPGRPTEQAYLYSLPPVDRLRQLAVRSVLGVELGLIVLWIGLAAILSTIAAQIRDWNDMTDELVWERLAISVWQHHSVLPHLHGEVIRNLAQLYPVLISPFFASGGVPGDLRDAHVFNAWVMSSAAIPAFLLARRVTSKRWVAYTTAVLAVCTPWIVYSTVLLTEVVAYPAFLWAVLAMHKALTEPSRRNDALVLVALAVAVLARTQFAVLLGLLPVALIGYERARVRRTIRAHVVLTAVYVPLALAALVFVLAGGKPSHLSVYGSESTPQLFSAATAGAALGHAADLAFGIGILPFLVGGGWLLTNVVRPPGAPELRAFAWIGTVLLIVLVPVVAAWDRTVGSWVIDRYLFYLAPILFLATLAALVGARRPGLSVAIPAVVVLAGFAWHLQPEFVWAGDVPVSFDSPPSRLYRPLAALGDPSLVLVVLTVALAVLFLAGSRLLRPSVLTAIVAGLLLVALPAATGWTFSELLSNDGHSSRPLTRDESGDLDWLDRAVGTGAVVTEVPYPMSSNPFVSQQAWRDLEFWNKSVRYAVHYPTPGTYADAVIWFPNNKLAFDPSTGAASASLSPYVLQSVNETRFRVSGNVQAVHGNAMLIDAARPWRTDWLTTGLYDDGWTIPDETVRIRVFAAPGQRGPVTRALSLQVQAPSDGTTHPFTLGSNLERVHGTVMNPATAAEQIQVCVPSRGYAVVTLSTPGSFEIPGDPRTIADTNVPRAGGVLLADLSLADEIGSPCEPAKLRP